MLSGKDKFHYERNLKLSVIASLSITILAFMYFPDIKINLFNETPYAENIISIVDIPASEQELPRIPLPPPIDRFGTPELFELEILPDINTSTNLAANEKGSYGNQSGPETYSKPYEASSLPFVPRQILEVLPKKFSDCSGDIILSLLIGKDGAVLNHKLLYNSTEEKECLSTVLEAAYKSKWQPVEIDDQKIEYWIEKKYTFEND